MPGPTSCKAEYFTVINGEDRLIPLRVVNPDGTSFKLNDVTEIRARFRKKDGSSLEQRLSLGECAIVDADEGRFSITFTTEDSNLLLVAERQDFSVIFDKGPLASIVYGSHTFTADHPGSDGNLIKLVFDGVKTAQQVVDAWNAARPDLMIVITAGTPSAVPAAGTAQLSGGTPGRRKVNYKKAITVEKQIT